MFSAISLLYKGKMSLGLVMDELAAKGIESKIRTEPLKPSVRA